MNDTGITFVFYIHFFNMQKYLLFLKKNKIGSFPTSKFKRCLKRRDHLQPVQVTGQIMMTYSQKLGLFVLVNEKDQMSMNTSED